MTHYACASQPHNARPDPRVSATRRYTALRPLRPAARAPARGGGVPPARPCGSAAAGRGAGMDGHAPALPRSRLTRPRRRTGVNALLLAGALCVHARARLSRGSPTRRDLPNGSLVDPHARASGFGPLPPLGALALTKPKSPLRRGQKRELFTVCGKTVENYALTPAPESRVSSVVHIHVESSQYRGSAG